MNISDLNYLEVQEDNVVGGSGQYRRSPLDVSYNKYVNIKELISVFDVKKVVGLGAVHGNIAYGNADAEAYGDNAMAQGWTSTLTTPYSAHSLNGSISVTD